MDDYSIVFARSARHELESLESRITSRIIRRIEALKENPRPIGCRRIRGSGNLWRIRVGTYRVIYAVYPSEQIVDIVAVRHRSEAYR